MRRRGPTATTESATTESATTESATTTYVVVDLPLGHVLLELGQCRGGIAAVESTDGHDRITRGQLIARGRVRTGGGRHPGVLGGVRAEQGRQLLARGRPVEEAAGG